MEGDGRRSEFRRRACDDRLAAAAGHPAPAERSILEPEMHTPKKHEKCKNKIAFRI
jgi:hypothetical protein